MPFMVSVHMFSCRCDATWTWCEAVDMSFEHPARSLTTQGVPEASASLTANPHVSPGPAEGKQYTSAMRYRMGIAV